MDIAKVTLPNQPDTIQRLHKCIRYAVASDLKSDLPSLLTKIYFIPFHVVITSLPE